MNKNSKPLLGSLLDMQVLYEKLIEYHVQARFVSNGTSPAINGMQFYLGTITSSNDYVYIATYQSIVEHPPQQFPASFVIFGEPQTESLLLGCSYIIVSETESFYHLANQIQQIILTYFNLEKKLNEILSEDGSLYDICVLAAEHFKNPAFIHDEYFNILACPQFVEGITNFTYNEQTGTYMQDAATLNNFRTSNAYKLTLATTGGQLWESDYDDTNSLYANIWIHDTYKGRFIVTDAISPLTTGQLHEVTYFSEIIKRAIIMSYMKSGTEMNSLQNFIVNAVNGTSVNNELFAKALPGIGWNPHDRYVCAVISFDGQEITRLSTFVICNDMQGQIPGSYTCCFKNAIYLLINLSIGNLVLGELRMKMSYIIRESLLHVGVSNEFQNIYDFPIHIKQGQVALSYAQEHHLTSWYNEFRDCVLEYWLSKGFGEFTKETIVSSAVNTLQTYDQLHGTDLYLTLKTYLLYERNSTLTARILKVHRSTLPHRLERITQLTQLNLDDFRTRLYLFMSFAILEELS